MKSRSEGWKSADSAGSMRVLSECAWQDPRKHTGDTGVRCRSGTHAGEYGVIKILAIKFTVLSPCIFYAIIKYYIIQKSMENMDAIFIKRYR